jgi:hypothetical protein
MGALLARVLAAVKFEWGNLTMMYEPYHTARFKVAYKRPPIKFCILLGFT